ncbi:MAG TPA: DNA polymerase, partial [Gemmatales bacterium]|nr:DNA polymerase [Gemmatales bacterium]
MSLRYLFIDMNSYFASVEQHDRPELRGQPVGVAPVLAETSCCIAASYEAKRRGVKTGTGVREARLLCPGITIVQANP